MRSIVLDTDLNFPSDDFQALLLLLAAEDVRLAAIAATGGNTWKEEAYVNLKHVLDVFSCGHLLPCFLGEEGSWETHQVSWARSLLSSRRRNFIGAIGKSDSARLPPDILQGLSTDENRTSQLARSILRAPQKVELLCLAPLSTVARLLIEYPLVAANIERLVIMGGRLPATSGDEYPADFNFWNDPVAANTVLICGIPIRLVPYDVCANVHFDEGFSNALEACRGNAAEIFRADVEALSGQHGAPLRLFDQLAALIAIEPNIVTEAFRAKMSVGAECNSSRGHCRTKLDPSGPVEVVTEIDRELLRKTFVRCILNTEALSVDREKFRSGLRHWDAAPFPLVAWEEGRAVNGGAARTI